jgi:hypothetical protein
MLTNDNNYALELMRDFPDDVRHPLVAESRDWDKIVPAMTEWISLLENGSLTFENAGIILRVLTECIYVMGYNRGKNEKDFKAWKVLDN